MAPNPEAIAWYLKRSERLLDDLQDRVQALRNHGGQLAGFSGAVLALVGANANSILQALGGPARDVAGASLLMAALLLISSLATALRGSLLPKPASGLSAEEVANYTLDQFTHEPDLWRVHVRAIRAILSAIESTTRDGDRAAQAVKKAEVFFLVGLSSVGLALAIVITEVTL